jgi:hypothetical protein
MRTPQTRLERAVAGIIRDYTQTMSEQEFLREFSNGGGCASGIVAEMVYSKDTMRWFHTFRNEINALLSDMIDATGCRGVEDFFGHNWDRHDPLAQHSSNQNLLAWFSFEETAYRLLERKETE